MFSNLSWRYSPVAIKDGVQFYHVNLLKWDDVAWAKIISFFGSASDGTQQPVVMLPTIAADFAKNRQQVPKFAA